MGTQKFFPSSMLKSHFTHVDTGYLMEFVYRAMFWVVNSFWVLVSNFLLFLFGFLDRYLHRLEADEISPKDDCSWKVDNFRGEDEVVESDGCGGREKFEYFSGFKFQQMENSPVPNTSKYQVNSRKDFRGFMEEPEHVSFTVQELFVGSNHDPDRENGIGENQENYQKGEKFIVDLNDFSKENDQTLDQVFGGEDFPGLNFGVESVILGKTEDSVQGFCGETVPEKLEEAIFRGNNFLGDKEMENCHVGPIDFSGGFEFSPSNSDGDDLNSENCIPVDEEKLDFDEKIPKTEGTSMNYSKKFDEDEDTDDEYIELDPNLQFSIGNPENLKMKGAEKIDTCVETEELSSQKKLRDSDDDEDEDDILLKHQDLIEQMKMEMKNARNKGLPTILEEFETPKMAEDLKPLKIDEKLEHKDRMEEIHKVYKSYVEKMRKLDILNYQTLHAISFLQFKDPTQSDSCHKSSSLAFKSLLLPSLWPCKLRRIYAADPSLKSIREMHRNLEMVYVGQLCLSWEILHWEFEKAKELLEHDSEGLRSYNLVADDFQQFQVLVLRFVENEQFQGPRVQMYAKNRCDLGAFLQVPAIKEDCLKEKKESTIEGENVVSIANLGEIIDVSMHAFSEFICADKDNTVSTLKGLLTTYVDLQDPSDSELLMEIKTSLRKKDKRLKDILRSGNCIVKKFQKQEEGRTNRDQLFAQVELKLVSRVLKMSKLTTDQLIWCQKKLNKINFNNRKVNVEPSFLLFPF